MKYILLISFLSIGWMITAQESQFSEPYVTELHHKKFRWMESVQIDSLNHILSDNVYYIHSNGWKETKSEILENLISGKLRYDKVTVSESECRVFENVAIITGKGIFNVRLENTPIEIHLYYTEVYSNINSKPVLISRHACKI